MEIVKNKLITSPTCSCCLDYADRLREAGIDFDIVDASSLLGKILILDKDIKGLPALVICDDKEGFKVYTGNYANIEFIKRECNL